ncbi:MAG: sulfurtransferase complex subunit TusB [Halioglobus sp.]|nr:sulfurtransferase complex subunit TusB [Halioglobus sp.]
MILHTLSASPASGAFDDCLRVITADDALLLLGDGVYAGIAHSRACERLLASGARLHVLRADASAAGVLPLLEEIDVVDMDGFVALTERYPRQLAWY